MANGPPMAGDKIAKTTSPQSLTDTQTNTRVKHVFGSARKRVKYEPRKQQQQQQLTFHNTAYYFYFIFLTATIANRQAIHTPTDRPKAKQKKETLIDGN